MKMILLRSILMLTILITSFSAKAEPLWGETTSGMSPSKVIEIVNGARPIFDGSTLGTGARELARVDDLIVVNESFHVSFFFIDKKLTQVTLSLNSRRSFNSTLLVVNRLIDVLSSKYGKELSVNNVRDSLMSKVDVTWVSGRTNISMLALAVGDTPAILNLNYQTRLSEESDKI